MKPNVVFITCHDLGRHLGCYGVSSVNSPQLDRLAAQGVRFEHCFCVAPQCSPSRATLLTGQHPPAHGVMGLSHGLFQWSLRSPETHLAAVLGRAGWHTALAGGQHETHDTQSIGFAEILHGGGFVPCEAVVDGCAQFFARVRKAPPPFYLQVGFFEPHREFGYGGATADHSRGVAVPPFLVEDRETAAEFAAFQGAIRKVDDAIGRVLADLESSGLAGNTIVVFAADHGIPFPRAKCSLYDPGLETALILRWPAARWPAAGKPAAGLVSNVDVTPTILDLLGVPATHPLQGRSLRLRLQDEASPLRDAIFAGMTYHDYYDPQRCIRTSTHKLIVNFSNAPSFMDPSQQWRPTTRPKVPHDPIGAFHPPVELYDLEGDPGETRNLAGMAEHADLERRLLAQLSRWMREIGDPLLTGVPLSPMHRNALGLLGGPG